MSSTRVAGNPIMARYVRKVFGSSNSFKLSTLTTLMRMSSLYELSTDPSLQTNTPYSNIYYSKALLSHLLSCLTPQESQVLLMSLVPGTLSLELEVRR